MGSKGPGVHVHECLHCLFTESWNYKNIPMNREGPNQSPQLPCLTEPLISHTKKHMFCYSLEVAPQGFCGE